MTAEAPAFPMTAEAPAFPMTAEAPALPQPSLDPDPQTVVAPPVLSPAPAGWKPDAHLASRKGEPLKAQELMSFGMPPELAAEMPTGANPLPPEPGTGPNMPVPWTDPDDVDIETNVQPAGVDDDQDADEDEMDAADIVDIPTSVGVAPVRKPSKVDAPPLLERDTEAMPARPRRGMPLAEFDDDASKKRDRHVAILVSLVGAVMIFLVYMATRYEEPREYNEHGPLRATGFESNLNGGGSKGGGGGGAKGGKKKGGGGKASARSHYAATAAELMPTGSCVDRCAKRQMQCSTGCGASGSCREHCLDRATSCENGCAGSVGSGSARASLECLTDDGRPTRCSNADYKRLAAQKEAVRGLCRDSKGEVVACPEHAARMEAAQSYLKKCGANCAAQTD